MVNEDSSGDVGYQGMRCKNCAQIARESRRFRSNASPAQIWLGCDLCKEKDLLCKRYDILWNETGLE